MLVVWCVFWLGSVRLCVLCVFGVLGLDRAGSGWVEKRGGVLVRACVCGCVLVCACVRGLDARVEREGCPPGRLQS